MNRFLTHAVAYVNGALTAVSLWNHHPYTALVLLLLTVYLIWIGRE